MVRNCKTAAPRLTRKRAAKDQTSTITAPAKGNSAAGATRALN
ncbi:MAG: hypothetical protein O6757_00390 [Alphaproteobacteria bacterium]|nr:hypothetical protein [Alphaproteobacteria bacterium]